MGKLRRMLLVTLLTVTAMAAAAMGFVYLAPPLIAAVIKRRGPDPVQVHEHVRPTIALRPAGRAPLPRVAPTGALA